MKKNILGTNLISHPWLWKAALAVVLLASFGLRMLNLQNPPLDFAIAVARSIIVVRKFCFSSSLRLSHNPCA